ncbi:PhoH family protein, partial [Burkholderia sp. TJI49]
MTEAANTAAPLRAVAPAQETASAPARTRKSKQTAAL